MDKQEYREFLEEIKKSYNSGNYEQVAAYSDELDFGKIKEPRILEMISDSYDHLGETDNAIDALDAAFGRNKTSKSTAYKLGELCIKAGDLDGAVGYYEEFRKLSNNSIKGLLLKYEIGKAGGVPTEELIKVLEKFTAKEKDEKWEYELARLYHEAGETQKCIEACDNICLWYSDGEYVKKALELKFSHTALTPAQQVQYERMMQDYLDPEERTVLPEPEEDEVALQLADEYFAEEDKKRIKASSESEEMTDTAKFDALQDTKVIPIDEIMEELEAEASEGSSSDEDPVQDEAESEVPESEVHEEGASEETVEPAEEEEAEPERPSNRITFEELRAMIHNGNSKKAQSGVFFTYSEPTEEEIAEEEALKAAREEARRRAEEEAARKAAEEQAAREAAAAAAREAERLEEEARVEAALMQAEEEQNENIVAEEEVAVPEKNESAEISDGEIDETKFINKEELLARLSEEEEKTDDHESLGFTAMIDIIASEIDIEDEPEAVQENNSDSAKETPDEDTEPEDDGSTIIFSREELRAALEEKEDEPRTPQQKLGAAIEQIIDDANATVLRDMEETKSIRIVLPSASANKIGQNSAKLSQYASSVIKPPLAADINTGEASLSGGAPRIIDNVDFSYIPISREEDGQLGLNIEYLTLEDDFEVEGQLTIDDVLNNYSKKLVRNKARVLDIESERLRQIQEAVNLTAPVKLPYSMDDLIFDDIEMSDIDGNIEEVEGDIFQFDPESIGVIPSDEELLAQAEAEEAEAEEVPEEETVEAEAEEVPEEESEEAEAEEVPEEESEEAEAEEVPEEETEEAEAEEVPEEETEEAEAEEVPEGEAEETEAEEPPVIEPDISAAEKAIAEFELHREENIDLSEKEIDAELFGMIEEIDQTEIADGESSETEDLPVEELSDAEKAIAVFEAQEEIDSSEFAESEIADEFFGVMAELGQMDEGDAVVDAAEEELLETEVFEEMFDELMAGEETGDEEKTEIDNSEEEYPEERSEIQIFEDEPYSEPGVESVVTSSTGYSLPDDMRESMSEFLLIEGMEQKIVNVVSDIVERKRAGNEPAGNLIVTGDIKSGKTFLAIEIIKAVTEELEANNGKVAKVQAELLNGKNIEKVFEKIDGSDLIIENVGYLDDTTIDEMTDVINSGRFTSMVIIEGNQLAVESIFANFPEFARLFENRIDINELSIVQWADIAIQYAEEKGFMLDDMAKLALHARINEINVPTTRLGYDEILDIMDDAIAKAEKRNSGKLFAAFKKNEGEKQEIIESDFM